jgi:hypothetical protein
MAGATEAMTSAGSTLAISDSLPATPTVTLYAALTYLDIGEITDLGSTGRTYNIVTHNPVGSRGTVKLKGSYNDGTKTVQAAYAPGNTGQAMVATALDDDAFYSFKETLQDGTILYYQAMVASAPVNVGTVDQVTGTTFNIEIKSGTIKVDLP